MSKKVVDVEMQKKNITHLRERIVSYCSGMVRDQMSSGDDYEKIKRVITITITGQPLITEDNAYHAAFAESAGVTFLLTTDDQFELAAKRLHVKTEVINPINFLGEYLIWQLLST